MEKEKKGMQVGGDQRRRVCNIILVAQGRPHCKSIVCAKTWRKGRSKLQRMCKGNYISSSRSSTHKCPGARSCLTYLKNIMRPVWLNWVRKVESYGIWGQQVVIGDRSCRVLWPFTKTLSEREAIHEFDLRGDILTRIFLLLCDKNKNKNNGKQKTTKLN